MVAKTTERICFYLPHLSTLPLLVSWSVRVSHKSSLESVFCLACSESKELYKILDVSVIICNNGMVFVQVLWGTNGTMKADLDNRHIKEDKIERVEATKHAKHNNV